MRAKLFILFLAAATGAVTMVLEFVLQRMLATQWGSSVEVWGSTIAVVLGGLALGYLSGGWLVDRRPERRLLGFLLLVLSWLLLLLGAFSEPLLSWLAGGVPGVRLGSLLGALLVLLLPSFMLGSVCPVAVRLLYADEQHVGRTAGQVYAVSTLGSIVGALSSAFYLLSAFQASMIVYACALLLALLAAAIFHSWPLRLLVVAPVAAFALTAWVALQSDALDGKVLAEQATRYQNLYVLERPDGSRQLVAGHPRHGIQSQVDPGDPNRLLLDYVRQMQRWNCVKPNPGRIVMLGGGAGSLVRAARLTSPRSQIDVVELDQGVLDISRSWLSLPEGPPISYSVEDARVFLGKDSRPIDLLLLDVFARGQVPAHLLSREFFSLARSRIPPDGLMVVNVIASPDSQFTASVLASMRDAFSQVDLMSFSSAGGRQNLLFFAGNDLSVEQSCLRRVERVAGLRRGELNLSRPLALGEASPFTDQRGPVQAE